MALLRVRDISFHIGHYQLLDNVNFAVDKGDRICLVGRNGAGKSSLFKIIQGELNADDGMIEKAQNIKISALTQVPPKTGKGSVFDIVSEGLGEAGKLVAQYHDVSHQMAENFSETLIRRLDDLQHKIETVDGWKIEQKVSRTISMMGLDPDADFQSLSGGMKRRVQLARALVTEPDLLLLDEPTNHLDINAIEWLEAFLLDQNITLLFITHDRKFLKILATKIIELDRGTLTEWPFKYDEYLVRKQTALDEEDRHNALFDKKLAQEEVWIRQGIKARRTRNEGRVRALIELRKKRQQRIAKQGNVKMIAQEGERSGKRVAEIQNISFSYPGKVIVKDFSATLLSGDKVGLVGGNGVGKTTFIKLLLGEIKPDQGNVKLGTNLQVIYFDQLREKLDENKTVIENVSEGRESVEINGQRKHIISYLGDFLFTPDRARSPVHMLSGGEKNRLLLANLFLKPSNVMVLDEPTNDLDLETLDLLQELISDYKGTVILVSHDRDFIDRVVTSTIYFEGDGILKEYVGGYEDLLRQHEVAPMQAEQTRSSAGKKTTSSKKPRSNSQANSHKTGKLGYKDQRLLDELPGKIENLESSIQDLQNKMSSPGYYKSEQTDITSDKQRLSDMENELKQAYATWESLESKHGD